MEFLISFGFGFQCFVIFEKSCVLFIRHKFIWNCFLRDSETVTVLWRLNFWAVYDSESTVRSFFFTQASFMTSSVCIFDKNYFEQGVPFFTIYFWLTFLIKYIFILCIKDFLINMKNLISIRSNGFTLYLRKTWTNANIFQYFLVDSSELSKCLFDIIPVSVRGLICDVFQTKNFQRTLF